jgi:hypothetical protein
MFEPMTFPTESAASPPKEAMKATLHSGKDVEKASKTKPTAVLLSPVISDTLTEFMMTMRLD